MMDPEQPEVTVVSAAEGPIQAPTVTVTHTGDASLSIADDPDRDGRRGVQSWPFVALTLGLSLILVGTPATLLAFGVVTVADLAQLWAAIERLVYAVGGAGVLAGGQKLMR